jgi:hypothetical protein
MFTIGLPLDSTRAMGPKPIRDPSQGCRDALRNLAFFVASVEVRGFHQISILESEIIDQKESRHAVEHVNAIELHEGLTSVHAKVCRFLYEYQRLSLIKTTSLPARH